MKYETREFKDIEYIIRYPKNFEEGKSYPVLFFLHGAGNRGKKVNDFLESNLFFSLTEKHSEFPFVSVAPLCDGDTWFDRLETLKELILDMLKLEFLDSSRVYAMGCSMGGYGVWQLAMSMPEVFAAIVPICGGGMYWNAGRLVDVNVWAFHGTDDDVVLARESQEMVKRINAAGGNAICTLYEGTGHNAWTDTYSNPEVFKWLLQFKKTTHEAMSDDKYSDSKLYG